MTMLDLKALANLGKDRGIPTCIDNTFMSPYCQRPLDWGIDIVVHSANKYISGHGDVVGGMAIGQAEMIREIKDEPLKDIGAILAPI